MAKASTIEEKKATSKTAARVGNLLERRAKHFNRIQAANEKRDKAKEKADEKWAKRVGKSPAKLDKIDTELAAFVERYQGTLTRLLSKTMRGVFGEVSVVLHAKEAEWPKDEKPLVAYMLKRRGGRKVLKQTWTLEKKPFAVELDRNPGLRAELRRFGVWFGKHTTISVKSPGQKTAKTISRRRYNEQRRRVSSKE